MSKGRLEAFSDGVFAILITILVLELRAPEETTLEALWAMAPVFASYVLSFVFIGIYWNNHHHMLQVATGVDGRVLWANLFLLFWLSLIPFATAWMGEHDFASIPTAVYGVVLMAAGFGYYVLERALLAFPHQSPLLRDAIRSRTKEMLSLGAYGIAVLLAAFVWSPAALAIYAAVAVLWFIPDRRMERALGRHERG